MSTPDRNKVNEFFDTFFDNYVLKRRKDDDRKSLTLPLTDRKALKELFSIDIYGVDISGESLDEPKIVKYQDYYMKNSGKIGKSKANLLRLFQDFLRELENKPSFYNDLDRVASRFTASRHNTNVLIGEDAIANAKLEKEAKPEIVAVKQPDISRAPKKPVDVTGINSVGEGQTEDDFLARMIEEEQGFIQGNDNVEGTSRKLVDLIGINSVGEGQTEDDLLARIFEEEQASSDVLEGQSNITGESLGFKGPLIDTSFIVPDAASISGQETSLPPEDEAELVEGTQQIVEGKASSDPVVAGEMDDANAGNCSSGDLGGCTDGFAEAAQGGDPFPEITEYLKSLSGQEQGDSPEPEPEPEPESDPTDTSTSYLQQRLAEGKEYLLNSVADIAPVSNYGGVLKDERLQKHNDFPEINPVYRPSYIAAPILSGLASFGVSALLNTVSRTAVCAVLGTVGVPSFIIPLVAGVAVGTGMSLWKNRGNIKTEFSRAREQGSGRIMSALKGVRKGLSAGQFMGNLASAGIGMVLGISGADMIDSFCEASAEPVINTSPDAAAAGTELNEKEQVVDEALDVYATEVTLESLMHGDIPLVPEDVVKHVVQPVKIDAVSLDCVLSAEGCQSSFMSANYPEVTIDSASPVGVPSSNDILQPKPIMMPELMDADNIIDFGSLIDGVASNDMPLVANIIESAESLGISSEALEAVKAQLASGADFVMTADALNVASIAARGVIDASVDGVMTVEEYKAIIGETLNALSASDFVVDVEGQFDDSKGYDPAMKTAAKDLGERARAAVASLG